MAFHYVVSLRGSLYGPFNDRMAAENWVVEYVADRFRNETVSWEIRGLRVAHQTRLGNA